MSNLIRAEIPQSNFEIIRNRLGVILRTELDYQDYVTTDQLFINPDIAIETTIPTDLSEMPLINISLASGSFGLKTVIHTEGTYIYNIDFFVNAKTNSNYPGDKLSSLRAHRLMGIVQKILDNPVYRNLGFTPGNITRVKCTEMNIAEANHLDSENTRFVRLVCQVEAPENNLLYNANLIDEYYTTAKLYLTDKGYILSTNAVVAEGGALLVGNGGYLLLGSTGKLLLG